MSPPFANRSRSTSERKEKCVEKLFTDVIDIAPPTRDGISRLELAMGAGTLTLNPGSAGKLVHGTISYNVPEWKPKITRHEHTVRIEQDKSNLAMIKGKTVNDWDLQLGSSPIDLALSAGAAKVRLDLGGLKLTGLTISQGASDLSLALDEPNQAEIDTFHFTAGAARSDLHGLGFLNARRMEFNGGAGLLALNFDGQLHQDLSVKLSASAGSVTIAVPDGVPSDAKLNGVMTNVKSDRAWSRSQGRYYLDGTGPGLTFDLRMSVGSLELKRL
jgi:hypothetical protein